MINDRREIKKLLLFFTKLHIYVGKMLYYSSRQIVTKFKEYILKDVGSYERHFT